MSARELSRDRGDDAATEPHLPQAKEWKISPVCGVHALDGNADSMGTV